MPEAPALESFSADERGALAPYFTNLDRPVFALRNLPEVVKAALFARYSRSPKSLRRLFLDEFLEPGTGGAAVGPVEAGVSPAAPPQEAPGWTADAGVARSERLFARVLAEYGDDSVAQLGGAHVAVEGASNLLTKVLEWGRLMAYLEQSTRYIPYTQRENGRWRYHVPAELAGSALQQRCRALLDKAFEVYAHWLPPATQHFLSELGADVASSSGPQKATARAQALDSLRGLLPAATTSNVGIFGSGQAYELLLLRMRAHPLAEVRACADAIRAELEQVIPAFLARVDRAERGGVWSEYLAATRAATERLAVQLLAGAEPQAREEVTLTDCDPEGEVKVVAAALYAVSSLPDDQLLAAARALAPAQRAAVLRAYVGERQNRRHKPGRAFERTTYRFDVLGDYGAFRDLQRHRMLSLEWQRLSPDFGYTTPAAVPALGAAAETAWHDVMRAGAELYGEVVAAGLREVAPYVLPMAYRVRFYMEMNAREAMHLIELRSTPQGHPAYRRIAQRMHGLIAERHPAIGAAMRFVDHSSAEQGRLAAEQASERKRNS
jgi:thymidylate synthase ThyX